MITETADGASFTRHTYPIKEAFTSSVDSWKQQITNYVNANKSQGTQST